ncbi:MAG: hypothetical protein O3B87_02025 [bacterium]|nr:hypothetical protein [bacterium]
MKDSKTNTNPSPTAIIPTSPFPTAFTNSKLPTPIPDHEVPTEPPTPIPKPGDVILDGIAVKDFKKTAARTTDTGDVILVENDQYQIVFYDSIQEFKIFIKGNDFEQSRSLAEQSFLQKLQLDEANACRLFVDEFIPQSAQNEYVGLTFGLSFCEHE